MNIDVKDPKDPDNSKGTIYLIIIGTIDMKIPEQIPCTIRQSKTTTKLGIKINKLAHNPITMVIIKLYLHYHIITFSKT